MGVVFKKVKMRVTEPKAGFVGWSYMGFNEFRRKVGEGIGLILGEMRRYGGGKEWPGEHEVERFLDHSDCDGVIAWEVLETVNPELRAIVEAWPLDEPDRERGLKLCDVMDECVRTKCDLLFT